MTDPLFWYAAVFAALCVGMGKGGLPVVAMLAVPVLSLVMDPMTGAALILPVYLISDVYGIWIYRHSFSARNLAILIPAGALGIIAGWMTAGRADPDLVRLIIGVIGLGFIGLRLRTLIGPALPPRAADVPRGLFWGALTGFTSFVSHAGGPPYQVYVIPQKLAKMTFAGTTTICFAVINWMKVPPYIALNLMQWSDAGVVLKLAPVAVFGAWAGHRLTLILPEKLFFTFVHIALFVVSLQLIITSLQQLLLVGLR